MFAYALASKPCSEATNMLYLSFSGLTLEEFSELNQRREDLKKKFRGNRQVKMVGKECGMKAEECYVICGFSNSLSINYIWDVISFKLWEES